MIISTAVMAFVAILAVTIVLIDHYSHKHHK